MQKKIIYNSFLLVLILVLWTSFGWAIHLEIPSSLVQEILSETVPSAFPLDGIDAEDFYFEWENSMPMVESAFVEKNSLQWVRVLDVIVLPRGLARVQFKSPVSVRVNYAGYSTGGEQLKSVEFPVALFSHPENKISLRLEYQGKTYQSVLRLKYRALKSNDHSRIYIDTSCSRHGVKADWQAGADTKEAWVYVGCRLVITESDPHRKSTLEMFIFWERPGAVEGILIDGLSSHSILPSLFALRLNAVPGRTSLVPEAGPGLDISYSLSERHYLGSLGLGLGPYLSEFNGEGQYDVGWSPLLTLYGSLFINESLRIVAFDATSISNRLWTDLGLYLSTENAKMFDQRMVFNLLFGGHVVGFHADGQVHVVPSFPQGFEFIYADAFKKGHNMSLGGFIYPEINGRSYYNLWWRWGGKVFGEINYLAAKESFRDQSVSSKSVGLTFGFPLARFW